MQISTQDSWVASECVCKHKDSESEGHHRCEQIYSQKDGIASTNQKYVKFRQKACNSFLQKGIYNHTLPPIYELYYIYIIFFYKSC